MIYKLCLTTLSDLLLLLVADIHVRFVLPRLLVQPLQYFVRVGVDVEVHLLVVVFEEVFGIGPQHLVDHVVGLEVACLARDDVDDEMFESAAGAAILDVDGGGGAGVEGLHGASEQLEGEGEVEHLDGFQVGELADLAFGCQQHICMGETVRPSRSCTMGISA